MVKKKEAPTGGKGIDGRTFFMKVDKITDGAIRYAEVTASGAKKPSKSAHFRTQYVRKDAFPLVDGELVVPGTIKVTIEEV